MTREEAYRLVQKNALQAWHEQKDFIAYGPEADPEITRVLAADEIASMLRPAASFSSHVDEIFNRVFRGRMMTRAVFLDRDGTINAEAGYLNHPDQVAADPPGRRGDQAAE